MSKYKTWEMLIHTKKTKSDPSPKLKEETKRKFGNREIDTTSNQKILGTQFVLSNNYFQITNLL
ncbi:hypothetical protein MtrunA17_Chr2g0330891 [Medicago truncatula]|uniref:Uncharacterized protein n=1 Tax=Medicago truncatula TaxID=3880 RepID=A0A396JGR1_MEDTR|nr:hypothetical protein MtrunA17_Chr2g0330891 [Medicago truncatula]